MTDRGSMERHENGSNHGSYSPRENDRESRGGSPRNVSGGGDRRDRSRSGSRSRNGRKREYSRSRERDGDDYRGSRRSREKSPMSSRRRHIGHRENPPSGKCLGIFGLSIYTQEKDLRDMLGKYGPINDVQIVYDAQTGRSRGFAFVYFENDRDAAAAKDRCNGIEMDGRKIRVDFSITQRAHTPTPGIYMGKPTRRRTGGGSGSGGGGGGGSSRYEDRGHAPRRDRDDYRAPVHDYRRDDYSSRPPPRDSYYGHHDSYSSRPPPPPSSTHFDDRYREPYPPRRRSPSPYASSYSRPTSSRFESRGRSRSYSPRKYYY